MHIPEEIKDKILATAKAADVVKEFVVLKRKGAGLSGDCPFCEAKNKFALSPVKDVWKCFVCDRSGKGSVSFLQEIRKMSYPDALRWLADYYKIVIPDEVKPKTTRKKMLKGGTIAAKKDSFRDEQLASSGIDNEDQKSLVYVDDNTQEEINRYESATINDKWEMVPGDDMVMHYVDLFGKIMTFTRKGTSKKFPLIRVRWQNPALHLDKEGTPMKYSSPWKSGSHLWIPDMIRRRFEERRQTPTLFVQEGEKKADKCCKHGMYSVGIMGIHNLAREGNMPHDFELLVKTCDVKNIVFLVDSDWMDMSQNIRKPVDGRTRSFMSAVKKFHDYFYAFNNIGIHLEIFFATIQQNEFNAKGVDDMMVALSETQLKEMTDEAKTLIDSRESDGLYLNMRKITGYNDYQFREIFRLTTHEMYAEFHKEELLKRELFKIGLYWYRFDADGKLELAQKLLKDEEYWSDDSYTTKDGRKVDRLAINYRGLYRFLQNRRYGRYRLPGNDFKLVATENKVVKEVNHLNIRDFVNDFTENAINKYDVLELLYRGSKMYLGPDSLSNLKYLDLDFHSSDKGMQCFYFKDKFWRITADGIDEKDLTELDKYVWENKIIAGNTKALNKPMVIADRVSANELDDTDEMKELVSMYNSAFSVDLSDEAKECHFLQFLIRTSNFNHTKAELSPADKLEVNVHLLGKLTAIGYLLHTYQDSKYEKAVIAMDGKLSEVGSSNGRTGKSLIGAALEHMVPTVYISGKTHDLEKDKFLWDQVDETTAVIFIDDVRINFDFEFLFPMITGKMIVERKGFGKVRLPKGSRPKFYIPTNHAINGDGASFRDRQFKIAFSDYYSDTFKPVDDFKILFFDDWDARQWNLFYNLMANCLQLYFKFGPVEPPMDRLEKRRLRQQMGESFLEWAELFFDPLTIPSNLNQKHARHDLLNAFLEDYPAQKKWVGPREFKKKLISYCTYKDYIFNPNRPKDGKAHGGDDKSGGTEYITIQAI